MNSETKLSRKEFGRMCTKYVDIVGCKEPAKAAFEYLLEKLSIYHTRRVGEAFRWLVDNQEASLSRKNVVFPLFADFKRALSETYKHGETKIEKLNQEGLFEQSEWAKKLVEKFSLPDDELEERKLLIKQAKERREGHLKRNEVYLLSKGVWMARKAAMELGEVFSEPN